MGFFQVLYILEVPKFLKCPILVNRQNSNILGKLGYLIKFYGKIPDFFVLITGHFGLFKTLTLRLGEAGTIQTQSQTQRLRIAKTDFKSVRKTIIIIRNLHYEILHIFHVKKLLHFKKNILIIL